MEQTSAATANVGAIDRKWRHVMVDLETLGTRPGSVALSIGAVFFDPVTSELGPQLHLKINQVSSQRIDLTQDPDTLVWWHKQGDEARKLLDETSGDHALDVPQALQQLSGWLAEHGKGPSALRLWGNGANFDNVLLAEVYRRAGIETPWKFWNDRCFRTLRAMVPNAPPMARSGTHHDALDDAVTQARYALVLLRALGIHQVS